jgi:hypothetical protein
LLKRFRSAPPDSIWTGPARFVFSARNVIHTASPPVVAMKLR